MIQFSCPPFFTQGITSLRWQLVNIKLYSFKNLFKSTFSTYAFCGLAVNSRNKTLRKIFRKNDRNCKLTISFLKISISMLQTYIKGKRGIYICVDNRDVRPFFNSSKELCLSIFKLPRMSVLLLILLPKKAFKRRRLN